MSPASPPSMARPMGCHRTCACRSQPPSSRSRPAAPLSPGPSKPWTFPTPTRNLPMRKLSLISFALAAAALFGQAAHADQHADITQRGTLVCGTLGTAAPFSYPNTQTREPQGYDVDFCAAVAKALGVKLELKLISVPARIPELMQGRVDVLAANLGWTPV